VNQPRYQSAAQRLTAFFNRLTKARLGGKALAPALAEAVGHELSALNPATDLPPEAARLWNTFVETYISLPGAAPADPLAKLRSLADAEAEDAMGRIGDIQQIVAEAVRKGRQR
jgi:hypothetical protein